MKREPEILLQDIKNAAQEIARFVKGIRFEAYVKNIEKQRAVERNFEIIGEALNLLKKPIPNWQDASKNYGLL